MHRLLVLVGVLTLVVCVLSQSQRRDAGAPPSDARIAVEKQEKEKARAKKAKEAANAEKKAPPYTYDFPTPEKGAQKGEDDAPPRSASQSVRPVDMRPGHTDPNAPHHIQDEVLDDPMYRKPPKKGPLDDVKIEEPAPPVRTPIHNLSANHSAMEALQKERVHHKIVLFVFSSSHECHNCVALLNAFLEVCERVGDEEKDIEARHRGYNYAFIDVALNHSDAEFLHQALCPDATWRVPFVAITDHVGHQRSDVPFILEPLGVEQLQEDLYYYLHRFEAYRKVAIVTEEKELMTHIFDVHNDGVTVALFEHPRMNRGRMIETYRRVDSEEAQHIHFIAIHLTPLEDSRKPEHEWVHEYNPTQADVVAFIVDEDHPDTFYSETFMFPELEEDEFSYIGVHQFRLFIDRIKGLRHKSSGRRFRGIRHSQEYHVHEDKSKDTSTPALVCDEPVVVGDTITVKIIGALADTNEVFLNWTDPPAVVTVGSIPQLPRTLQHSPFVGLCAGSKKDVFIPAHLAGYRAEYYSIEVIAVATRPARRSASASVNPQEAVVPERKEEEAAGGEPRLHDEPPPNEDEL